MPPMRTGSSENFNSLNLHHQSQTSEQKALQQSHSKILMNLSRNFQDFKDDIKDIENEINEGSSFRGSRERSSRREKNGKQNEEQEKQDVYSALGQ